MDWGLAGKGVERRQTSREARMRPVVGGHRLEPSLFEIGHPRDRLAMPSVVALFAIVFGVYLVVEKAF